jgi:hypothetical protein
MRSANATATAGSVDDDVARSVPAYRVFFDILSMAVGNVQVGVPWRHVAASAGAPRQATDAGTVGWQGVPLTLNALELRNPTLTVAALGELLARRYGTQMVAQLYKVSPQPCITETGRQTDRQTDRRRIHYRFSGEPCTHTHTRTHTHAHARTRTHTDTHRHTHTHTQACTQTNADRGLRDCFSGYLTWRCMHALLVQVVGALDLIGNPVNFVSTLSTGVEDFFYEPWQGAIESPRGFAVGLGRGAYCSVAVGVWGRRVWRWGLMGDPTGAPSSGTASLLRNTVQGVFDGVSRVTGAVGKGVAAGAMDPRWEAERRAVAAGPAPEHAVAGVAAGAMTLVRGIGSGLAGVVTRPVAGAREGGALGFAKGVGAGVVGIVAKPVAAVFDGASQGTHCPSWTVRVSLLLTVQPRGVNLQWRKGSATRPPTLIVTWGRSRSGRRVRVDPAAP